MAHLGLATILAVAATAGIGYVLLKDLRGEPALATTSQSSEAPDAPDAGLTQVKAAGARETGRTDTILSCEAVDGTVFYTNASRCDDADLENRINIIPAAPPASPVTRTCLGTQEEQRVHHFLASCQEPFMQAIGLERRIGQSDDPANSPRTREYCALITQGVQNGCIATSDVFCYLDLCQKFHAQDP